MITIDTDSNFTEVKFTIYGVQTKMARMSFQIGLEKELRMVRKKIGTETDPAKKSRLISAYEDLVEKFKA